MKRRPRRVFLPSSSALEITLPLHGLIGNTLDFNQYVDQEVTHQRRTCWWLLRKILCIDRIKTGKILALYCLVSPHMSGDYAEFENTMVDQFIENWQRYLAGESLFNLVDKHLGFAQKSPVND